MKRRVTDQCFYDMEEKKWKAEEKRAFELARHIHQIKSWLGVTVRDNHGNLINIERWTTRSIYIAVVMCTFTLQCQ